MEPPIKMSIKILINKYPTNKLDLYPMQAFNRLLIQKNHLEYFQINQIFKTQF